MITIKITGGLGNQMFQYAAAVSIAKKLKTHLGLDLGYYLRNANWVVRKYELKAIFGVDDQEVLNNNLAWCLQNTTNKFLYLVKILCKRIYTKLNKNYYLELSANFNNSLFDIGDGLYMDGYFQSEKYFISIESEIRKIFTFCKELNSKSIKLKQQIEGDKSIFIHIRRGDYVTSKITNLTHGTCDLEYYYQAISFINKRIKEPNYYIFSDDPTRVKENLKIENAVYVDHNHGDDSRQDMALMSYCKHAIIANSTFSRWGAWLILNKDKIIIAPKRWITGVNNDDIYGEGWILF